MSERKIDYLIIGGGMAGCNVAYNLIKNGKTICMIDDHNPHSASNIAAGIYNPLLPRHHKIAYNAEKIYPMIAAYYKELEAYLGEKILFEQSIHYVIESNTELNDWGALAYHSHLSHWIEVQDAKMPSVFKAPFGFLKIKHSGWVDAKKLIGLFKEKLNKQEALRNEVFDYAALEISENEISYKNIKAKNIIFCDGCNIINNTFNGNIQLKPAKGEILIIKTEMAIDFIAQQGVFMVPLGENLYKVGSTFSWDELDEKPTEGGKKEILKKLNNFFRGDFEIVDHYAGVRPSSGDRRPILGKIKPHENVFIFNGLGSKGVALAPYYSTLLVNNLLNGEVIEREVNAERLTK